MAPRRYTWISLWFLITAPIILWDASYVLMRPRSMEGGDLRWFWSGFDMYERIDTVYSVKGYHEKAGFAPAAAISNLIETSLNEYFCGGCSRSELNKPSEILKFWVAPNMYTGEQTTKMLKLYFWNFG
ncbi:hypothetical protein JR316_0006326 [Psilocybe cubensis]|uniref:Uncharacterized protein n=1 Tax=Psilocybe cubensis TaxID=181762 RepID=A0ACB8H276_PSICU|nr:hypothetical protein JR316_0006326 [Psilocybe cubensis]KAH9481799.1 hypothetical protein JR316_0006326 [Psilocybe cubensis]